MNKIAIDIHGQDGPISTSINAAILFAKKNRKTTIILVGNIEEIKPLIKEELPNIEFEDAQEVIKHTDGILEIRRKPDSSLVKAINLVKDSKADAVVSAGPSGPYMAACYLILKVVKENIRPAFAPILPTIKKNKKFIMLDVGANADTTAEQIMQFAIMGQSLAKALEISKKPTVKLLNSGSEEKKGNMIYKEAHQLLKNNKKINFLGNLEPKYIMDGEADVAVCGGFEGNLMSKTAEGVASSMAKVMRKEFKRNPRRLLGAMLLKNALKNVKGTFDNRETGGGIILGVNGLAIKAHGSTDTYALVKSLELANKLINNKIIKNLKKDIK